MKLLKSLVLLVAAVCLIAAVAQISVSQAADEVKKPEAVKGHDFVGSKACKACHMGAAKGSIFETWEKSKHASAFANLPDASKKDTKCLACHTTGYGKGGYDPAAATAATLEGVGCESCHGPGKDYKAMAIMKDKAKAKEMGMIMPDAATCKGCHDCAVPDGHKALPKFEYVTMYKTIEHHIPKK